MWSAAAYTDHELMLNPQQKQPCELDQTQLPQPPPWKAGKTASDSHPGSQGHRGPHGIGRLDLMMAPYSMCCTLPGHLVGPPSESHEERETTCHMEYPKPHRLPGSLVSARTLGLSPPLLQRAAVTWEIGQYLLGALWLSHTCLCDTQTLKVAAW